MTIEEQEKPGPAGEPMADDAASAAGDEAVQEWERVDVDEVDASADDGDILASEEVEIIDEDSDLQQDDPGDDNPYQESDEALPGDKEEAAIRHDLLDRDQGERFGD
jgi:hypothetical protein